MNAGDKFDQMQANRRSVTIKKEVEKERAKSRDKERESKK